MISTSINNYGKIISKLKHKTEKNIQYDRFKPKIAADHD